MRSEGFQPEHTEPPGDHGRSKFWRRLAALIGVRHRSLPERDRHAALAARNDSLQEICDLLEQQISDRTHELEQKARYLEVLAKIAGTAASLPDQPALLSRIASLIGDQLELYHVGLYMLDSSGEWATLAGVSGDGGRRMLDRGYRLGVREQNLIAYVARRGEVRIVPDVKDDALYHRNADLPETRSELALPLFIQGKVIGVLDVHSQERAAFDERDAAVYQGMADQLAMAIHNSRLFSALHERIDSDQRAYSESSLSAWQRLIEVRPDLSFVKDREVLSRSTEPMRPEAETVLALGREKLLDGAEPSLLLPIKVRDHVVGVVDARLSSDAKWASEEALLLQAIVEQLGQALESAQLYEDAQRRAARERLTRDLTDKFRSARDMRQLLQTAVQETAGVLGASRAFVQWVAQDEDE